MFLPSNNNKVNKCIAWLILCSICVLDPLLVIVRINPGNSKENINNLDDIAGSQTTFSILTIEMVAFMT